MNRNRTSYTLRFVWGFRERLGRGQRAAGPALAIALATCLAVGAIAFAAFRADGPGGRATRSETVPLAARLAVSRGLGADTRAFWVRRAAARLTAADRVQGLKEGFARNGVTVSAGGQAFGIAPIAVLRPGLVVGVEPAAPSPARNRVTFARGPLTEWYANGPLGLEQGFVLHQRLAGVGPLAIRMHLTGSLRPALTDAGRSLTLSTAAGHPVLAYRDLSATDAGGRALPVWLSLDGRTVSLTVNDAGARYPVQIDPIVQLVKLAAMGGASGDLLGSSVAISGDTAAAGAYGASVSGNFGAGAVYIFVKPAAGWAAATQTAELTASSPGQGANLGTSVAIDGGTVVAGAPGAGSAGTAYVFSEPAGGWASQPAETEAARLTAPDAASGDELGTSVAISGGTVVAGAPFHGTGGAAYVFTRPGATWSSAVTPAELTAADTFAGQQFGRSVGVSAGTVIVGAPNDLGGTGAAYVFTEPPTGWADTTTAAKLIASDGAQGDELGYSVAVDGAAVVAGAPHATVGAQSGAGAAYVFTEPGTGWAATSAAAAKLTESQPAFGDQLGQAVAISGSEVIAGAFQATVGNAADQGVADVFDEPAGGWASTPAETETATLTASDGAAGDEFGRAVAVSSGVFVAGALNAASAGGATQAGAAYVFGAATPPPATLTVTVAGAGSGRISGDTAPAISCPGTCAQSYPTGTVVTLTESASSGSSFAGWGGACESSGEAASCRVAVTADTSVSAGFITNEPAPTNRTPPHVDGTAQAGQQVHCIGDVWVGLGAHGILQAAWFKVQYVRGVHGVVTRTVTQVGDLRSLTVPDFIPGVTLYCTVTANGETTATSKSVTVQSVRPAIATIKVSLHGSNAPSIDPSAGPGDFNYCTQGVWLHYPTKYSYAWYVLPHENSPISAGTVVATGRELVIGAQEETGYVVCQVTASNSAGSTTALSNRYLVLDPDLGFQIDAIEITQGIQTPELPTRTGLGEHVAYHGVQLPWSGGPTTVKLAAYHKTVVRVYTTAAKPIGANAMPTMVLTASRGAVTLGQIEPDQIPPAANAMPIGALGRAISTTQRQDPLGAYTFTLPQDWTIGDVTFTATLGGIRSSFLTCGLACSERRTIILGPEHFNPTTKVWIDQLSFVVHINNGPCPGRGCIAPASFPGRDPVWDGAQAVTAMPIDVHPENVELDGTGIINATSHTDGFPCLTNCTHSVTGDQTDPKTPFYHWQNGQLLPMVVSWGDSNDNLSSHYPFALTPAAYASCCFNGGVTAGDTYNAGVNLLGPTHRSLYGDAQPESLSTETRPFAGVAHEMHHGFGYKHDDINTCGGDKDYNGGSENWTWPPDNQGDLDGIGLDTSSPSPYRLIYAGYTLPSGTIVPQVYDIMSYCPTSYPAGVGGEQNHWLAVRNWNRDVEFHAPGPTSAADVASAHASAYRTDPPATTADTSSLAVTAVYELGSSLALSLDVQPDSGSPSPYNASDEYQLIGLDASGAVVTRAGANGTLLHSDRSVSELLVTGKLAAAGVRAVEVVQDGTTLTTVHASPHAPVVKLSSPIAGAKIGGAHGAVLRWRSSDADGDALEAVVRYSADGGGTWRTVYMGADHGVALLPSGFLSASTHARVRLYVTDGFNETIVTSPMFTALGAPPTVSIASPVARQRLLAGGALVLQAYAYDDTGMELSGRSVTWRVGRQVIAHGASATIMSLPAGRDRITVTARDRLGRTASASVTVTILPSPPVIRVLEAPGRISPRARSVTLRIALLAPARLTVRGRHYVVGRDVRVIRVPVKPGRRALGLVLMLRSGRYTQGALVTVNR